MQLAHDRVHHHAHTAHHIATACVGRVCLVSHGGKFSLSCTLVSYRRDLTTYLPTYQAISSFVVTKFFYLFHFLGSSPYFIEWTQTASYLLLWLFWGFMCWHVRSIPPYPIMRSAWRNGQWRLLYGVIIAIVTLVVYFSQVQRRQFGK